MSRAPGRIRIIAGEHRGRMIDVPPGSVSRPTGARVREALFSMLEHADPGVRDTAILDACAGSGAFGLEALSRGAAHATFFETDRSAFATLEANARALGLSGQTTTRLADACKPPRAPSEPCGIVFLDPPYDTDIAARAPGALAESGWIDRKTLLVVESRKAAPVFPGTGFDEIDRRTYGDTVLFFMKLSG